MGNCHNEVEIGEENKEFEKYKTKLIEELESYLNFIYDLKKTNTCNVMSTHYYFLVPRFWFDSWLKRIEILLKDNIITNLNNRIEYKNENKSQKFFYELIPNDLWLKFVKNKLYNLSDKERREKMVIRCNNILLIDKENELEIFYFER